MKGRFEVITAENPREIKIFGRYEDIPDNIIEVILFKPNEEADEGRVVMMSKRMVEVAVEREI